MKLDNALKKLSNDFSNLNWAFLPERIAEKKEIVSYWPGDPSEDIMICVLKTNHMNEVFHRQDFFFINFAYKNDFEALSENSDNRIKIREMTLISANRLVVMLFRVTLIKRLLLLES